MELTQGAGKQRHLRCDVHIAYQYIFGYREVDGGEVKNAADTGRYELITDILCIFCGDCDDAERCCKAGSQLDKPIR